MNVEQNLKQLGFQIGPYSAEAAEKSAHVTEFQDNLVIVKGLVTGFDDPHAPESMLTQEDEDFLRKLAEVKDYAHVRDMIPDIPKDHALAHALYHTAEACASALSYARNAVGGDVNKIKRCTGMNMIVRTTAQNRKKLNSVALLAFHAKDIAGAMFAPNEPPSMDVRNSSDPKGTGTIYISAAFELA